MMVTLCPVFENKTLFVILRIQDLLPFTDSLDRKHLRTITVFVSAHIYRSKEGVYLIQASESLSVCVVVFLLFL